MHPLLDSIYFPNKRNSPPVNIGERKRVEESQFESFHRNTNSQESDSNSKRGNSNELGVNYVTHPHVTQLHRHQSISRHT